MVITGRLVIFCVLLNKRLLGGEYEPVAVSLLQLCGWTAASLCAGMYEGMLWCRCDAAYTDLVLLQCCSFSLYGLMLMPHGQCCAADGR